MGLVISSTIERYLPGPAPFPVDAPELHALAQYVRAGRCALFVGAGLSAGAGLPTWDALMAKLVQRITRWAISEGTVPDEISIVDDDNTAIRQKEVVAMRQQLGEVRFQQLIAAIRRQTKVTRLPEILALALEIAGRDATERAELDRLLKQKRYPELAEYCRERLGASTFDKQVRRALVPKRGLLPAHKHIVRTPFSCVVTTNFDTLLEQAYTEHGDAGTPRAPTGAELTQFGTLLLDGSFFVLKAHGDALRPETMVFSANDYRRMIHATPAFQAVFSSILMTNALLFVGYSLSDTNFRLLLDQQFTVFNGQVPPRYALLSGVGDAEADILWDTARLQVLSYPAGKHEHLEHFLKALADITTLTPAKPKKPAARRRQKKAPPEHAPAARLTFGIQDDHLTFELSRPSRERSIPQVWAASVSTSQTQSLGAAIRAAIKAHEMLNSAEPEIAAVGQHLDSLLPDELRQRLKAIPRDSLIELVCGQGADRVPWEWISVGGKPLCLRNAIARRPVSLTDTARGYRRLKGRGRALIIGDAGSGQPPAYWPLDGAEREAAEISKRLRQRLPRRDVTHLSRAAATRDRILSEVRDGDYDIIHFGGHAWFTDRESYFWAWDQLILGSELTPLLSRRPPSLLVMSTHFTSFVPWGFSEDVRAKLAGRAASLQSLEAEPASGFAEVAMRCGVAAFVGSFGEPPDLDSAETMIAFYEALLSGKPVTTALLTARRRRVRHKRTSSLMLTVTGYGALTITGG